MNIERIRPQVWNSRAVVHGDLVYLSGLVADDKSLSTKGQTEQVLAKIDDVLAAAGTNKSGSSRPPSISPTSTPRTR